MKKILFLLLISTAAFGQYNGTIIRGVQYTVNAGNSRTAELNAGEIFTGTITSVTTGEPNVQISISTDQPLEVMLRQYNNIGGTEPLAVIYYDVEANVGLNQNVNLVGNFFNITVQNKGIAATTTLNIIITTGFMTVGARNYIAPPLGTDEGMGVRPIPQINWRTTFSKVLGSTWDTDFWARVSLGTGMANSQSAGNGVITSGTTANAETILRSRRSFNGSFLLRAQTTLSQRIVNNNFIVELVDVIGDGLVLTGVSATSCTVTIPNNPFTSENVGQSINIGAISAGTIPGTLVPGRYAIASVAGNNVTFTVAGWTGATSGTGTCSLFGWNYHQLLYTGTTVTNASYDAQRKGWATGATTATINTTASPGHMAIMASDDGNAFVADQLVASATTLPILTRASRVANIADETADLWVQIRALNGTTAPASTTTWTIGTVSVENFASQQVTLASTKVQGANSSQPVSILGSVGLSISNGQTAHSSASSGSPVRGAGRVTPTTPATVDLTLVAGDAADLPSTTGNQLVTKNFSTAELDYTFNFSSVASTTTVQQFVPASGTASVRNCLTGLTWSSDALGAGGVAWILDGALTVSSIAITTGLATTSTAHDLKIGDAVVFTALASGTGVSTNTIYYVTSVGSTTTFNFSLSIGGSNVVPSVAYTGTTVYRLLYQQHFRATGIDRPMTVNFANPNRGLGNAAINFLIPTSMTSGTIYVTANGFRLN